MFNITLIIVLVSFCLRSGLAETIKTIFPPFPVPEFIPNFTGYDLDQRGIDWYDMYEMITPDDALEFVRTNFSVSYGTVVIIYCRRTRRMNDASCTMKCHDNTGCACFTAECKNRM